MRENLSFEGFRDRESGRESTATVTCTEEEAKRHVFGSPKVPDSSNYKRTARINLLTWHEETDGQTLWFPLLSPAGVNLDRVFVTWLSEVPGRMWIRYRRHEHLIRFSLVPRDTRVNTVHKDQGYATPGPWLINRNSIYYRLQASWSGIYYLTWTSIFNCF